MTDSYKRTVSIKQQVDSVDVPNYEPTPEQHELFAHLTRQLGFEPMLRFGQRYRYAEWRIDDRVIASLYASRDSVDFSCYHKYGRIPHKIRQSDCTSLPQMLLDIDSALQLTRHITKEQMRLQ